MVLVLISFLVAVVAGLLKSVGSSPELTEGITNANMVLGISYLVLAIGNILLLQIVLHFCVEPLFSQNCEPH